MSENKIFYLPQPDLGDLMSTILSESSQEYDNENRRLVFTEYRPATRGFYNHIGIPKQDRENIIKWLKKEIDEGKKKYSDILDAIVENSKLAHKAATNGDFDAPSLKPNILVLWEKILVSLKEKYAEGTDTYDILEKLCSDSEEKIEGVKAESLYNALKILSENMPAPSNSGLVGKKEVHGWKKKEGAENNKEVEAKVPTDIGEFEPVAIFEYFFGMRASPNGHSWQLNSHARINVFLDTGEYVGQIVAFAPPNSSNDDKNGLLEKGGAAACLVRSVLPGIRQARYVNAILRGGPGNVDRIMVHHLPYLLPVTEFFVRIYDDGGEAISWSKFFEKFEEEPVLFYSSRVRGDNYYHDIIDSEKNFFLEPYRCQNASSEYSDHSYRSQINDYLLKISDELEDSETGGFVTTIELEAKAQNIFFCFSTEGKSEGIKHVRVIVVIDNRFLPAEILNDFNQYRKRNFAEHNYLGRGSAARNFLFKNIFGGKNLAARLNATIATMLKPEEGIVAQIRATSKEERTYAERYGTVIYEGGYLDQISSDSSFFKNIKKHIDNTKDQLTNPLFAPRGFRNIAYIIVKHFFDELWKYLEIDENDKKPEESLLGKLLYSALDFEETLNLSPGYREHFVHSYHVFLLGLYLINSLECFTSHRDDKKSYKKWFLASMYHDIGYPLEKIEDISKDYLKKLLFNGSGDDIQCRISIDNGILLLNDEFINNFNVLIDKFVDNLLNFDDQIRSSLYSRLIPDTGQKERYKNDVKNKFTKLSYGALTKDADHGIFSALLFLNAANQMGSNFCTTSCGDDNVTLSSNDIMDIALAIFAHNTLDRSKAPGHKWHLTDKDFDIKLDKNSINFGFSVFCYNILSDEEKGTDNWLGSLLILCDAFSQWGRNTRKDDKDLACLVPRSRENISSDPKVCLCYPMLDKNKAGKKLNQFYAPQLCTILADPPEENIFQVYVNPSEKAKCPMRRSHDNDISKCVTAKGIDGDCISIDTQKTWSLRNMPDSIHNMHEFDEKNWNKS